MIITIALILFVLILGISLKYHIIPLIKIELIKRKFPNEIESVTHFGPSLILEESKNMKKYNDSLFTFRNIYKKNPNVKVVLYKNSKGKIGYAFVDPELIKQVHQSPESFQKTIVSPVITILFKNSLLYQSGKEWQRQRQILGKSFHFDEIKNYLSSIKEVTQNQFKLIEEKLSQDPGYQIQVEKTCSEITSEIVFRAFFGSTKIKIENANGEKVSIAEELIASVGSFWQIYRSNPLLYLKYAILGEKVFEYFPTKKEKQQKARFQNLKSSCDKIVQQRKEELIKDPSQYKYNFLDLYLKEVIINKNKDITNEEIIDTSLSLFYAGTDTTANLAGSALYFLSINQSIQEQARQEVLTILKQKYSNTFKTDELFNQLTMQDIQNMNLINSILKETLRLMPSVPNVLSRRCVKDIKIGKFQIKKGTPIGTFFISNQNNPSVYPNPERFDPSRWMNQQEQNQFHFTPFSLGPRNCIGQHLAMIEAKSILSYVLLHFNVLPNPSVTIKFRSKFVYGVAPDNFVLFKIRENK